MKGPFTRTVNVPLYYMHRIWYTQEPPYHAPLRFVLAKRKHTFDTYPLRDVAGDGGPLPPMYDVPMALAYEKFVGKLGDSAMWAVNLAEWRSAAQSVNSNAAALERLGRRTRRRAHGLKIAVASLWLEYSFQWRPLVQDIYSSLEILSSDLPAVPIRAGHRGHVTKWDYSQTDQGLFDRWVFTTGVSVRGRARVSNPNLYLLNKLGFLDPAKIAWELVPWSFVLDWFTNLGSVIGQFSDTAGISLEDMSYTRHGTMSRYYRRYFGSELYDGFDAESLEIERTVGMIPGPPLIFRPFKGWSLTRGANAISLLVQQLRR